MIMLEISLKALQSNGSVGMKLLNSELSHTNVQPTKAIFGAEDDSQHKTDEGQILGCNRSGLSQVYTKAVNHLQSDSTYKVIPIFVNRATASKQKQPRTLTQHKMDQDELNRIRSQITQADEA